MLETTTDSSVTLSSTVRGVFNNIRQALRGLKIYALVGKSGTGKSFRAKMVAEKYDIEVILDDGLAICNDKIIAGHTAKREKYYLQAVKTALYDDVTHRQSVINALEEGKFKRILILGTSVKMVNKIVKHLNLPPISKIITIEEISSPAEIEVALKNRAAGRHIIPVPSVEIRRNYSQIFYDTIKIFFERGKSKILWPFSRKDRKTMVEKTIVRTAFQDGHKRPLKISEQAILEMVKSYVKEFNSSFKVLKVRIKDEKDISYSLRLSLATPLSKDSIATTIHTLQDFIKNRLESFTGIILNEVHISVDKIIRHKKQMHNT
jgi:uncharacterized alkaline shock family protein YloU/adenylate kinase family enzyme